MLSCSKDFSIRKFFFSSFHHLRNETFNDLSLITFNYLFFLCFRHRFDNLKISREIEIECVCRCGWTNDWLALLLNFVLNYARKLKVFDKTLFVTN